MPEPELKPAAAAAGRAVLFDLDGTLIDTNELIVQSFQHVAQRYLGRTLDPEREIHPTFGEPLRQTLARWDVADVEEVVAAYRAFNLEHHDALVRAFPGAAEVLAALRRAGLRLAVVTSKLGDTAWRGLRVTRLDRYVDIVVGADEPVRPKPSPEALWLAIRRLGGVPLARVAMIGDSPHDLRAARAAGVRAFGVGWSVFPRAALLAERPEAVLVGFAELLQRVGADPGRGEGGNAGEPTP